MSRINSRGGVYASDSLPESNFRVEPVQKQICTGKTVPSCSKRNETEKEYGLTGPIGIAMSRINSEGAEFMRWIVCQWESKMPMELRILYIIDMYFLIIIFFSILKAFRIEKPLPLPSDNRKRTPLTHLFWFSIGILHPLTSLPLTKETKSIYRCSY